MVTGNDSGCSDAAKLPLIWLKSISVRARRFFCAGLMAIMRRLKDYNAQMRGAL